MSGRPRATGNDPLAGRTAGGGEPLCYVRAALPRAPAHPLACAAAVAAILPLAGCGGDAPRGADESRRTYTVAVERAAFPPRQRLAQRSALVIAVRNAGDAAIPNLVVTVRGFSQRRAGSRESGAGGDVWIVDEDPRAAATAFEDSWAAGRLEPGRSATLRWEVTPVVPGTHELTYAFAPAVAGGGGVRLRDGGMAAGSLTVRVAERPAPARVDPRTGAVERRAGATLSAAGGAR